MSHHLSASIEDYLKAIYSLTLEQERASTTELAGRMNVTAASATGMVQKLAALKPALVEYQKHRGVNLTDEGRLAALEIIRHHRLLEAFLHEKLGYGWEKVHAEADRLEHVISEELEEHISQALGDPAYDPHGDPIPTRELKLPHRSSIRMSELRQGDWATVQRISDANPDLLSYLSSIGLRPNSKVTILEASPFDGNLHFQVSGQDTPGVLGLPVTSQIYVTPG